MIVLARGSKTDGSIKGVTQPPALPGLILGPCTGVKTIAITMDAVEHNFGIFVEDVLSAVAVMDIPVDDEHALKLVSYPGMLSGERDVVEETEAHTLDLGCMVSGRPHQAKRRLVRAFQHGVDCRYASPGRRQSDREGVGTDDGVRFDAFAAVLGNLPDLRHELGRMQPGDRLFGERFILASIAALRQTCLFQQPRNGAQPLRPFGMIPAGLMLQKQRIAIEQCHRGTPA